jgi:hypothetical protein
MARVPKDPELQRRGVLVRALGRFREMLPGALIYRRRPCGKSGCRCQQGREHWHGSYQLVVPRRGSYSQTYHVPTDQVDEIEAGIAQRKAFEGKFREILAINLRRWLETKKKD